MATNWRRSRRQGGSISFCYNWPKLFVQDHTEVYNWD